MLYINIFGISILAIFFLFILQKANKRISDYSLILIIILFAGILGTDIWMKRSLTISSYLFHLFFNTFIYPSIIIYGLLIIDNSETRIMKMKWLWIVSYPILFSVFIISDILFFNNYNTTESVINLLENPSTAHQVFYKGNYAFLIIVLFWFLKKINNYTKGIKNCYSSIDSIHLNWFRYFIYGYLVINILSLFLFLSFDFGILNNIKTPFNIEYTVLVLLLFYLCYNGIKQYSLASFDELIKMNNLISVNNGLSEYKKYKSSSLSDEEMNNLYVKIENLFKSDQVFLDPQLKINDLAKELKVTTHKVSQTINTKSGKSFYDFVNQFRVKYFKELLSNKDNRKFTILALGIESGFNSKASLNRIFKEYAGQSPKKFQQINNC